MPAFWANHLYILASFGPVFRDIQAAAVPKITVVEQIYVLLARRAVGIKADCP